MTIFFLLNFKEPEDFVVERTLWFTSYLLNNISLWNIKLLCSNVGHGGGSLYGRRLWSERRSWWSRVNILSQRKDKITEPCLPPKYRGLQLSNQINDKSRRCLARDVKEAVPVGIRNCTKGRETTNPPPKWQSIKNTFFSQRILTTLLCAMTRFTPWITGPEIKSQLDFIFIFNYKHFEDPINNKFVIVNSQDNTIMTSFGTQRCLFTLHYEPARPTIDNNTASSPHPLKGTWRACSSRLIHELIWERRWRFAP